MRNPNQIELNQNKESAMANVSEASSCASMEELLAQVKAQLCASGVESDTPRVALLPADLTTSQVYVMDKIAGLSEADIVKQAKAKHNASRAHMARALSYYTATSICKRPYEPLGPSCTQTAIRVAQAKLYDHVNNTRHVDDPRKLSRDQLILRYIQERERPKASMLPGCRHTPVSGPGDKLFLKELPGDSVFNGCECTHPRILLNCIIEVYVPSRQEHVTVQPHNLRIDTKYSQDVVPEYHRHHDPELFCKMSPLHPELIFKARGMEATPAVENCYRPIFDTKYKPVARNAIFCMGPARGWHLRKRFSSICGVDDARFPPDLRLRGHGLPAVQE